MELKNCLSLEKRSVDIIFNLFLLCFIALIMPGFISQAKGMKSINNPEIDFTIQPSELRCEYLKNPLGIDVLKPRFSWIIESPENGQFQSAYQIMVASNPTALINGEPDIWNSGIVNSSETVNVSYEGKELGSCERYYWQVRSWDKNGVRGKESDIVWFETGLFSPDDWKARWITGGYFNESPLLRRSFMLEKQVESVRLYICGQGSYKAYINGRNVGDEVLGPALSYFGQRMYYDTYDVAHLLQNNENVIGVWLAPGWFGDVVTWTEMKMNAPLRSFPRSPHALIAQILVHYTDGSADTIVTDSKWKAAPSPLQPVVSHWKYGFGFSGEVYDATMEKDGWNNVDYVENQWKKIDIVKSPTVNLSARMIEPNRIIKTTDGVRNEVIERDKNQSELIETVNRFNVFNGGTTYTHLPNNWYDKAIETCGGIENYNSGIVYDLGRHISGWVEVKVKGKKGDWVNLFGADCYRLKGGGEETISLQFIHRVVRYVPILFFGETKPEVMSVRGLDINNDVESAGDFSCSDDSLTELSNVIKRTIQAHTLSGMMMDSWQERFGTFVPGEAAVFNWNLAALCNKLTMDVRDQQEPDGGFMMFGAPISFNYPTLKDLIVNLPWLSYLYYGDKRILEDNYQSIKRYTELIIPKHDLKERTWRPYSMDNVAEEFSGDHGRPTARWYDPHTGDLFETLDMTFYFQILEKIAKILGEDADAERYIEVQKKLIEKINLPDFFDKEKVLYGDGDQGCQTLALILDIVPSKQLKKKAEEALINDIMVKHEGHLNTGFKGSVYLLQTLIDLNRPDVAYSVIANKQPPSLLSMLDHPLTPERLTIMPEFYTGGMIPHPGLSTTGFWFYKGLGGINPDPLNPGFRRIIIRPQIVENLDWVNAEYNSIRGKIKSYWKRKGNMLEMNVVIPANTDALIHVPGKDAHFINTKDNKGTIKKVAEDNYYTVFSVPGGTYLFSSQLEF